MKWFKKVNTSKVRRAKINITGYRHLSCIKLATCHAGLILYEMINCVEFDPIMLLKK